MLNPYIKNKFCTSIYKGQKFEDEAYDQNAKFSVHLPVEEDKYLQKLNQQSIKKLGIQKTRAKDTQVDQFDLADKEFDKKSEEKPKVKAPRSKTCDQKAKTGVQKTKKTCTLPKLRSMRVKRRKRFGKTMSNRMRPLGPWYYEKYQVKRGMNKYNNSYLKPRLYFDYRTFTVPKTTLIRNRIIDEILREERLILQNNLLRTQLMDLKRMDLIKIKQLVRINHPGMKKREYVYNDTHSKATNTGYNRTDSGNFYK